MTKHIPVYLQQGEKLVKLRPGADKAKFIGQPVDRRVQAKILASPSTAHARIHMIPGLQWYEVNHAGDPLHINVTDDMSHVLTGNRRTLFTRIRDEVEQIPQSDRPRRLIVR